MQDRTPWGALALIALPPALIAVLQLGRLHPDEVFQVLQPAQRFAFGDASLSWEWRDGLRNWALPGLFGLVLEGCGALGIADPQLRRAALEVPQYALHVAALAAVYRLIQRRAFAAGGRADDEQRALRGASLCGVALVAWHAPVLHYAGRTLTESISAGFLLWGLERADLRGARAREHLLGGALLGLAVVVRYGSAVVVLTALLVLIAQRRPRELAHVALGGCAVALLLGALDWFSWGRPFHSLLEYYAYNVGSERAAQAFGAEPWSFYLRWIALGVPPWSWCALLFAFASTLLLRARAAPRPSALLLWCAASYLLALTLTPHKEVRFLYPGLLLISAALAPVWVAALASLRRTAGLLALALSLASGLAVLSSETRFEPRASEQFRLFVKAVRDGRGVVLLHTGVWGTPGAFYAAGRRWRACSTPRDACTGAALRSHEYDRVVGWLDEGRERFERAGYVVLERQGNVTLWGRPSSTVPRAR